MIRTKKSIRYKLMYLLLISSLVPLSIAMLITYGFSSRHYKNQTTSYTQNLMYQFQFNIQQYLNTISDAIYYPYSNGTIYNILNKKSSLKFDEYSALSNFMQSIYQLSDDISSVYLDCALKNTSYIFTKGKLSINNSENQLYNASHIENIEHPTVIPTHQNHSLNPPSALGSTNQNVFTFAMPLRSIPQNQYLGKIAIDINLDTLNSLSSQMINEKEDLFILDKNTQQIISSTNNQLSFQDICTLIPEIISDVKIQEGVISTSITQSPYMLFHETVEVLSSPWILLKAIPMSSMYDDVKHILKVYLPTYFIFLFISVAFIYNTTSRFTRPIIELANHMKNISFHQKYKLPVITRNDEIEILYNSFSSMLDTINALIIQKYELKLSNKNAQLRMLQAQLNPHFLNNSLQSLATLALQKDSPKLYSLITCLGQMMNYTMDIKTTCISFDKELEYTKNYLLFQHQRFGDSLHYFFNISPETLKCCVPKMILQPIIENYFIHGFVKRPEGFQISISSKIENEILTIIVKNNGETIPIDTLKHLSSCLKNTTILDNDETAFGIGLINIQSRLNLYFHNQAQILLQNLEPYGLQVKLILNLKGGANDESFNY